MRPAIIAVNQEKSERPPMAASCECSRVESSRVRCAFHADNRLSTITFIMPKPMAENLIHRKGLPAYSVALVAKRQMPLIAAVQNPVAAIGTVGIVMAANGMPFQTPNNLKSKTSTAPKSRSEEHT